MADPLGPAKRLRNLLDAAGATTVGLRSVRGVLEITFDERTTPQEQAAAQDVLASFRQDDDAAQQAWEADQRLAADLASIDSGTPTPAALLAIALESGKGGTDAAIKTRAKAKLETDRRARGGRP